MADSDKLWFEIGVRDSVTKTLNTLMAEAEKLGNKLSDAVDGRAMYENALKIEQAYDRIAVALRKIEHARGNTANRDDADRLDKMKSRLESMRSVFERLASDESAMGEKGRAALAMIQEGFQLAMSQVDRYTGSIEAASKAEERDAAERLRRTDALKARYNELASLRKQFTDAVDNASPATNINGRTRRMGQSLDYRLNAIQAAMGSGGPMPKSATGADFDQFLRDVRSRIKELTADTDAYNTSLLKNESIQRSLGAAIGNTASQMRVADVKGQRAEYDALSRKLRELGELRAKVEQERQQLEGGGIAPKDAQWSQAAVSEELAQIQNRYNETLARSQELARQDTDKKRQSAQATRELAEAQRGLVASYDKVSDSARNTNGVLGQLQQQMAGYFSLIGIERLLKSVIQIGGEFEVQHIALQSILGDVQQANSMFEQMKELAVVSPFNFRQLASYSKQIAAFGIPYEEMYDTTKRLADMSAGLGVDMGRLILAYGQVRSASVLRGQELRQFTEAGIPMVQALAQEFTRLNGKATSTAEVFELISKRAVPFEMVKKVLWDMTDEGGRFYDMQYTLADTLAGKWSNLQDAWEIMLSDIAKGESLSGRLLKSMTGGLTTLIEHMNTLLPLLGSVGGFFALRRGADALMRLGNLGNFGLNGIERNVTKAQQLHSIELRRRYLNMQITAEQYRQGMALNRDRTQYYMLLAQEGRLREIQIARAVQQRRINTERLQERVLSGELTTREAAQLRLWRMKYMQAELFKLSLQGIKGTISGLMGPVGWISLALDAVLTTVLTIAGKSSETARKNQDFMDGFVNRSKELKDSVESLKDARLQDTSDYKSGIDGLKEMLKQHARNYDAIMVEASGISDLQKRYEYLRDQLRDAQKVYQLAEKSSVDFADSTRSAFKSATDEARDYFRHLKKDVTFMSGGKASDFDLDRFNKQARKIASAARGMFPGIGTDAMQTNAFRQLRDAMLQELGSGSRESMMIRIRLNEILQISDGESAADLVMPEFDRMLSRLAPQIANKIKYGSTLTDAERKKVQELMDDAIKETGRQYPEFASYLQGKLDDSRFTASIQLRIAADANANELQKTLFKSLGNISVKDQSVIMNWLKDGDLYAARNQAKQDIDAARNQVAAYDNAIKQGKKELQPLRDKARSDYNSLVADALVGLGYDYEGELKKSNKDKDSGGKTDKQLKKWKEEWNELKAFYTEFKKWAEVVGSDAALKKLYETGLWGQFFNADGTPVYDMKGWGKAIREYRKKLAGGSTERDQHIFTVEKEALTPDYDQTKKVVEAIIKQIDKAISEEGKSWDLYKKIFDATGNRELAGMTAFGTDTDLRNFVESLRRAIEGKIADLPKARGYSVDQLLGMDDEQLREIGIFEKSETGVYQMLKKLREEEQSLKKEEADLFVEALKNAKSLESELAQIEEKYRKIREAIQNSNLPDAEKKKPLADADKNEKKDTSAVNWKYFKERNDWGRVFGDLGNMGLGTIEQMITAMEEYSHTTEMSTEETMAWYEAMDRLTNERAVLNPLKDMKDAVEDCVKASKEVREAQRLVDISKMPLAERKRLGIKDEDVLSEEEAQERLNAARSESAKAFNRLKKAANELGNSMQRLGSAFSSLGSSIGGNFGDTLGNMGNAFSQLGNLAQSLKDVKASATGFEGVVGRVGAVMTAITAAIELNKAVDKIVPDNYDRYEKAVERQAEVNKLRMAVDDYARAVAAARAEESEWFAGNDLSALRSAGDKAKTTLDAYYKTLYEAQEAYKDKGSGLKKWGVPIAAGLGAITAAALVAAASVTTGGAAGIAILGAMTALESAVGTVAATAIGAAVVGGIGAAVGQIAQSAVEGISYKDGQKAAKDNLRIQTRHKSFWRGQKTKDLVEWVRDELNAELFDEEGLVNLEAAQQVLDKYGDKLVGETKETLERLVEIRKEYDEFIKQIEDYVGNIGSGLADAMTNAVWDWLSDGEDALDKFREYASDTWRQIAKDLLKTFWKVKVLDKYSEDFEKAFKDYALDSDEENLIATVTGYAGGMAADFQASLPLAERLAQIIADSFGQYGYDVPGSDGSSGSSNKVISGDFTEAETGQVVSYLNAIRADVSVQRGMLLQYLPQYADMMQAGNVIAESQLRQMEAIAYNTAQTAENTYRIADIYTLLRNARDVKADGLYTK